MTRHHSPRLRQSTPSLRAFGQRKQEPLPMGPSQYADCDVIRSCTRLASTSAAMACVVRYRTRLLGWPHVPGITFHDPTWQTGVAVIKEHSTDVIITSRILNLFLLYGRGSVSRFL
ncbi:hypothetical protein BaRGS_00008679, partial [Batillaria attramentaria]